MPALSSRRVVVIGVASDSIRSGRSAALAAKGECLWVNEPASRAQHLDVTPRFAERRHVLTACARRSSNRIGDDPRPVETDRMGRAQSAGLHTDGASPSFSTTRPCGEVAEFGRVAERLPGVPAALCPRQNGVPNGSTPNRAEAANCAFRLPRGSIDLAEKVEA